MKQFGDITKLNGAELEPVDLIVGGSPCQDLSIAGNRAGLKGERSGLFMEMIRIVKEMRRKTDGIHPRFILWENVVGAFSSGEPGGADFSAVLGEFARIIEPDAPDVPCPEEGWPKSGVLLVSDGQIAWRTHDAQFWGVPQRRRRISLIVDLRGRSAAEILFERKGLSGNIEPCEAQREGTAGTASESTGSAKRIMCLNDQGGSQMEVSEDKCATLPAESHQHEPIICDPCKAISFQERSGKPGGEKGILIQEEHTGALNTMNNKMVFDPSVHHEYRELGEVSETVRSRYGTGGNNVPMVVKQGGETVDCLAGNGIDRAETAGCNGKGWTEDVSYTLNTIDRPAVMAFQGFGVYAEACKGSALKARNDGESNCDLVVGAKCADDYKGVNNQIAERGKLIPENATVRRLTPLECERLQGFPDGWTDIPGATDSKRYRALGNSIALPFWEHLAKRFVSMGGVQTIGSLFDGIGGFPLVFQRAGAETLWTSEIEPFCEQVVAYHFGGKNA